MSPWPMAYFHLKKNVLDIFKWKYKITKTSANYYLFALKNALHKWIKKYAKLWVANLTTQIEKQIMESWKKNEH